jgi:hypothetical protein
MYLNKKKEYKKNQHVQKQIVKSIEKTDSKIQIKKKDQQQAHIYLKALVF